MLHLNDLGLLDIAKGREELVKFCLCGCGRDASNKDSKKWEVIKNYHKRCVQQRL